jgi:hypothetical protein
LLQILYWKIHNDLLSDGPSGLPEARHQAMNVALISDTAFRVLTPPQLWMMTKRHKNVCGCKTHIIMLQMQKSFLNSYHYVVLQRLTKKSNGKPLHEKPKDTLLAITGNCRPWSIGIDNLIQVEG